MDIPRWAKDVFAELMVPDDVAGQAQRLCEERWAMLYRDLAPSTGSHGSDKPMVANLQKVFRDTDDPERVRTVLRESIVRKVRSLAAMELMS